MSLPFLENALADPEVAAALAEAFEFRRVGDSSLPEWFRVIAPETFAAVAQDATGGVFLVGQATGRVLLVTSEGQAGVVGRSIQDLFQLMVTHPFWRDLLKFSAFGDLTEMKKAAPLLLEAFEDEGPPMTEQRLLVASRLGLSICTDAVDRLHEVVTIDGADVQVEATVDGTTYEGLFGGFTVEDNPFWRGA